MKCPICHRQVKTRDDPGHPNPHYPFCTERCKVIDLGRWLDGKYQIPVASDSESDEVDESTPANEAARQSDF